MSKTCGMCIHFPGDGEECHRHPERGKVDYGRCSDACGLPTLVDDGPYCEEGKWAREFCKAWKRFQGFARKIAAARGYKETSIDGPKALSLIHSEVSEVLEVVRKDIRSDPSPKARNCSRYEEELADIVICVMDLAEAQGCNVASAIVAKMRYNEQQVKLGKGRKCF